MGHGQTCSLCRQSPGGERRPWPRHATSGHGRSQAGLPDKPSGSQPATVQLAPPGRAVGSLQSWPHRSSLPSRQWERTEVLVGGGGWVPNSGQFCPGSRQTGRTGHGATGPVGQGKPGGRGSRATQDNGNRGRRSFAFLRGMPALTLGPGARAVAQRGVKCKQEAGEHGS